MKRYYIFQLPHNHPHLFDGSKRIESVNLGDYVPAYTDQIDTNKPDIDICEHLYYRFNMERPQNFAGHSMSVSDVIMIKDGETINHYFCDSLGFAVLKKTDNPSVFTF